MAKFLTFARKLALLTPTVAACASSTPAPTPTPTLAAPTASTSASETTAAPESSVPETVATGPCRCSWDTNAAAADRVCKKGEANYNGQACVASNHPKWNGPVKGPLPPPDLPC